MQAHCKAAKDIHCERESDSGNDLSALKAKCLLSLRQSVAPTKGFTGACRQFVQEAKESEASQVELFLNSVPLFKSLSREEKLMLVDALEEHLFPAGTTVITQARASLQSYAQPSAAKVPHRHIV